MFQRVRGGVMGGMLLHVITDLRDDNVISEDQSRQQINHQWREL